MIVLPFPPSTNNLFINVGKRRIRSPRYDGWRSEAIAAIWQQRPAKVAGPFRLTLTFDRPDNRARDLDNLAKAPLDALVHTGVIEGDHLSREITLRWSDATPAKPGSMRVELVAA